MARSIEDYAMIGDCQTAALVGRDGAIDWLCWPRFDSPACFAALLGASDNGYWRLGAAAADARRERRYRGDTLILETRLRTDTGSALLLDFMPPRGEASDVVRLLVGEEGEVAMRMELLLRFGYGADVPWVSSPEDGVWRAIAGPDMVTLCADAPLRQDRDRIEGDFVVRAGESRAFVMTYSPSHRPLPARVEASHALAETTAFWEDWVRRGRRPQRWEAQVVRSLVTLRALIYTPTGGIVAAPTTSLPEFAGGSRNWDYRFCWLRDATLTLLALMDAGYVDEAAAWRDWLLRAVAGRADQIQIMYGIAGERHLPEWELGWLGGFADSRPVRVGNAAHGQRQLDVFGEVMDVLHQARAQGIGPLESAWTLQRSLLDFLATIWEQPDHGIWETRGPMRHWTYSKIMCWLAFDRAILDAERYSLDGPIDEWRSLRERIHRDVCTKGFDARRNSFVQWYGSDQVDASLLQIPTLGFLEPTEPRVLGTIAAIEQDLLRDGLVRRYDTDATDDGLPPGEGAFLACSFWLADAYVQCGRQEDAERLFEHLQGLCNDVGLLSEQYDPRAGRMLGNFPQAFSHLSLIATAFNLSEGARPAAQRSGQQAGPLPQARSRGVPAGRPPSDSGGNAGRARFSRRS